MKYSIAEPIRKMAFSLHLAATVSGILGNIKDTWNKSKNKLQAQQFIDQMLVPRIPNWQSYLRGARPQEYLDLKEGVLKNTDNKVKLDVKGDKLEFAPARG